MPSKSRRAASRQAQLKRRRRGRQRVQEFDAGPTEPRSPDASADDGADEAVAVMPAAPASQTPARRPHRSRRQAASEAPLSYDYLGSEIRRIGVITAMIAVVLVLLTFLLGG